MCTNLVGRLALFSCVSRVSWLIISVGHAPDLNQNRAGCLIPANRLQKLTFSLWTETRYFITKRSEERRQPGSVAPMGTGALVDRGSDPLRARRHLQ